MPVNEHVGRMVKRFWRAAAGAFRTAPHCTALYRTAAFPVPCALRRMHARTHASAHRRQSLRRMHSLSLLKPAPPLPLPPYPSHSSHTLPTLPTLPTRDASSGSTPGWYDGLVTDFRERSAADAQGHWGHCIVYDMGTPQESFEWVYIPVSLRGGAGRGRDGGSTQWQRSGTAQNRLREMGGKHVLHCVVCNATAAAASVSNRAFPSAPNCLFHCRFLYDVRC